MGKIYDNKIPTQLGFKYTERVVADDRTEVQSLEDLKTLVVPPYFVTFVRDVLDENGLPTPYCWNGNTQTDLNNWVNPLELLKIRTTNLENATNALTSGVRYNIPQAGNTPTNEPAPTQDGIYRVKTINATYTNFGGIVVPNDAGFIYDIQVSGIGTTPVYTLLSTDLNLDIDNEVIEGSPNPVKGGAVYDEFYLKTLYRKPIVYLGVGAYLDMDFTNSLFKISTGVIVYTPTGGATVPDGDIAITSSDRWIIFNKTDNTVTATGNSNFKTSLNDKDYYVLAQFHPVTEDLNFIASSRYKINGVEMSTKLLSDEDVVNKANIATNTSNIATNTSSISANTTNIATNTSNLATNTTNISDNTTNIATNTSNINVNTISLNGETVITTETIGNENVLNTSSLSTGLCVVDYSIFSQSGTLQTVRLNLNVGGLVKLVHFRKTSTTWNEIANYDITGLSGDNDYDVSGVGISVQVGDTFGFFSTVATLYYNSAVANSNFRNVTDGSLGSYSFTSATYPNTTATSVALDMQFTANVGSTQTDGVVQKVASMQNNISTNATNISTNKSDIDNNIKPQLLNAKFAGRLGLTGHIGRTELVFDNTTPKTFRRIFTLAQHCDYVRIGFFNASTSNYNIAKASVTSLDTTSNYNCTGLTFTNLKFNGNENAIVPASAGAQRRNYLVSDWVALSSLTPSDDATANPKICVSAYIDSAQNLTLMGKSDGTTDFTNWATHPSRPMVFRYNDGDCVTTPANFVSTTNRSTSPIGFVQYVARGQVVTLLIAGDSIANGEGGGITYAGQTESFNACVELSDLDGVCYDMINLAWSGTTTDHIRDQVLDFLPLNVLPDIAILPVASPNDQSTITDANITNARQRNTRAILECEKHSIKTIVWTWLATNQSIKDYDATDSLRRDYNDYIRALANKGVIVADYAFILDDPTNVIDGQVQLKAGISDGIHPNDAGKTLLTPVAKNAILAHSVAKTGSLITA